VALRPRLEDAYRSRLSAKKRLRREEARCASNVSRRLTGSLEEPGIVSSRFKALDGGAWW